MAPDWLLAPSALGIALLPLSVASVVFAIVNERQHQQLRDRASSDDLTGALSRRGLRERGERLLSDRGEAAGGVAVLMIDVDHFKAINDRHGHLVGDQVLRHVTALLSEHLREDALLARYGGEEFTVVLPVRSHDDALTVAERLRQVVEQQPCEVDGQTIAATVSIGVAFHRPAASLEDALSRADARLYEAKQAGRNRISGEGLPA
jgi:diguanylate cyclase (GGDEF)-like protein